MINIHQHFEIDLQELSPEELESNYSPEVVSMVLEGLKEYLDLEKDFKDIAYGEYVGIETALSSDLSPSKRVLHVLCNFYRFNGESGLNAKKTAFFENIPAGVALTLFDRVMNGRKSLIFEHFKGVIFSDKTAKDDNSNKTPSFEDKFYRVFGWYDRQKLLCREFNIPLRDVENLPLIDCLNEFAYQKFKGQLEEIRLKEKR